MSIFEAVKPLDLTTKTMGQITLKVGDTIELAESAADAINLKFPGSLRAATPPRFQVGDRVRYRQPDRGSAHPIWREYAGVVDRVHERVERVTISSDDRKWIIIAMVYVRHAKGSKGGANSELFMDELDKATSTA